MLSANQGLMPQLHLPPQKQPGGTVAETGDFGLLQRFNLLLEFFGAPLPLLSTAGYITEGHTQPFNLFLFLGRSLFPAVSGGAQLAPLWGAWCILFHLTIPVFRASFGIQI
jgi:hypothetical protein